MLMTLLAARLASPTRSGARVPRCERGDIAVDRPALVRQSYEIIAKIRLLGNGNEVTGCVRSGNRRPVEEPLIIRWRFRVRDHADTKRRTAINAVTDRLRGDVKLHAMFARKIILQPSEVDEVKISVSISIERGA